MFNDLVKSLAEKENVNEQLKAAAPMVWVQKLNNIRNRATGIVWNKILIRINIIFTLLKKKKI